MNILMPGLFDPAKNDACKIHFYEVARSLARQGHRVTMLVPACRTGDLPLTPGLSLTTLPFQYRESLWHVFLLSLIQILWYARTVTPETDAVYVRWRMFPAICFRLINRLKGLSPVVITEHNGWVEDEVRVQHGQGWMERIARLLQIADGRSAHGVVAVVDGIAERLPEDVRHKTVVVDNGTNLDRFHPMGRKQSLQRSLLGKGGGPIIGFTGNISRWQGVDDLIRAFAAIAGNHPDAKLIIAGDGPYLTELKAMAKQTGQGERIRFAGDVPYEKMNDWLNLFDLAVVPKSVSLAHIGYSPLKVRDCAAAGLAVAATRVRGLTELEEHGWLVTWSPDEPDGLANLLDELLSGPDRLAAMGTTARQYAETHFSWDKAAQKVTEFIQQIRTEQP
ncbi:glycosyltransferase family 4 protein [Desulfovibrio sp. JC010]|uniref:glycosyltransferase family 4 protein n=1 Tax=Desulfovibrio sp. JC010 TaxID=2593641 RepID=UPI0013CF747B|nr:glycosyltransferase family 4 protein [Desulfovibrio sp. JC010]